MHPGSPRAASCICPPPGVQVFAQSVQTLQIDVPTAAQRAAATGAERHAKRAKQQRHGQEEQGDAAGRAAASVLESTVAGSSLASSSRAGRHLQGVPWKQQQRQQQQQPLVSKQRQLFIDLTGGSMRCAVLVVATGACCHGCTQAEVISSRLLLLG